MPQEATTITPLRRLFVLLGAERNDLWVAVVFSVAIGLLSLVVPIATQALVNSVAFGNLLQPLVVLSTVVLVVLTVSAVLQIFRFRVVEVLQRRLFVRLASESADRLLRSNTSALRLQNGPELVNRFLDVVTVQKAGATLMVDGLSVAMQTMLGMILLAVYHPWLLAFDAVILAALLLVIFPLGSRGIETAVRESKAKYALVAWLEEIARNSTAFRGVAESQFAFGRCDTLVKEYLGYRSKHFRVLLRQFAGSLGLQAAANAALLGVGGMLVVQRQLTLGQLVAAELIVAAVLSGISKLAKHLETFYDLLAALDKLGALTGLAVEQSGSEAPARGPGPMGLRVSAPAITMDIAPGERVALTGPSGAGKSTILDLIAGYADMAGSIVEMDGVDRRSLHLPSVRSEVALVRGAEIFHGSVLENVRVGRALSMSDVQRALERVGVWAAIQRLPEGVNTVLATGGAPLAEGARQAVVIARALVGLPRLILIDEALDAIHDSPEREALLIRLFEQDAPWTLIVVTSRPELQRLCDRAVTVNAFDTKEAA